MKKTLSILLACLMLVSLFAGCGGTAKTEQAPQAGSTAAAPEAAKSESTPLRVRASQSLVSLDWQTTTATYDMQITWVQLFEGLYGMNEADGGYYNLLAKDIQISDDGLVYTITLQDATFQNGDPLTAEDVVFSYELAMQNSRFGYVTSMIDKIEAADEKTVVLTLLYPYSAISHTFWSLKIYSKREYEETVAKGIEFGTVPHTAGTGPYIVTSYDPSLVVFKANENYWGGAPAIKDVEYRVITEDSAAVIAFENGELDYIPTCPLADWDNLAAAAGEHSSLVKGNNVRTFYINQLSPNNDGILANQKVREAIFYAINRNNIVSASTSGLGQVAYEYMPHEYVATSPNYEDGNFKLYEYNVEMAKQCLIEAGFTEAQIAEGINVGTITTYGAQTAEKGKAAIVIQQNLADCGMVAEVEVADTAIIAPRLYAQDFDMAVYADSGNYDYNNIRQQVHSESDGMYLILYKYEDSPFDWERMEELCALGVATSDIQERYDYYTELWSLTMDTATILPLYHNPEGIVWSDRVNLSYVNPTYYHFAHFSWAE